MRFKGGRALVIGVANYDEIGSLPEAVINDAIDLADALKSPHLCGYPDDNVIVLTDDKATLDGIRAALADVAIAAQPQDTVVIFFSGHGTHFGSGDTAMSVLIPSDCRRSNPLGTTLGEAELSAALAAIKAQRLLVIIDACHAGGAATLKDISGPFLVDGFDEKSLQRLAHGTGRVVLASSRASETSLILPNARNSVFSAALLEALKGGIPGGADGTIRIFDLFNCVAEKVRQTVPGRQHPIFKASDVEDNFPVALALGGQKSIDAPVPARENMRTLEQIMSDLYPAGPTDQDIWLRAGGDLSRLRLGGTGRASWFTALRTLSHGGGGPGISQRSLIETALEEFPNHPELCRLAS